MKNSLRLGAAVAAAALVGISSDSAKAIMEEDGNILSATGKDKYHSAPTPADQISHSVRGELNPYMPPLNGDVRGLVRLSYEAGKMIGQSGHPDPTMELGRELSTLISENFGLRGELDATRAQVADLIERLNIMETTCEDATSGGECPAECTGTSNNTYNGEFILYNGASCLF